MRNETFGIDVSAQNALREKDKPQVVIKHIDWDKCFAQTKPAKVAFVAMRAAISWGYVDPAFAYNWAEVGRHGVPRAAYHVFYPGEDPVRQARHFCNVMKGDWGELPPVADVELHHNVHPIRYQDNLKKYLDELERITESTPIIYSRASFMDKWVTGELSPPDWYNRFDWWLAHYLTNQTEHPGPPALPKGVDHNNVIIHQTSENKVAGAGQRYGLQSNGIDYNRWIGPMSLGLYLVAIRPKPEVEKMISLQKVKEIISGKTEVGINLLTKILCHEVETSTNKMFETVRDAMFEEIDDV